MNLATDKRDRLLADIADLKIKLKDHFEILEFNWLRSNPAESTPADVFRVDIRECVNVADGMIAICDYPSLGLGYEMGTAIEDCGIPVLAVAHKNSIVSKLIIGIDHKDFKFIRYTTFDEVAEAALKFLC